jgi:hypothetical protein
MSFQISCFCSEQLFCFETVPCFTDYCFYFVEAAMLQISCLCFKTYVYVLEQLYVLRINCLCFRTADCFIY